MKIIENPAKRGNAGRNKPANWQNTLSTKNSRASQQSLVGWSQLITSIISFVLSDEGSEIINERSWFNFSSHLVGFVSITKKDDAVIQSTIVYNNIWDGSNNGDFARIAENISIKKVIKCVKLVKINICWNDFPQIIEIKSYLVLNIQNEQTIAEYKESKTDATNEINAMIWYKIDGSDFSFNAWFAIKKIYWLKFLGESFRIFHLIRNFIV